MTSREFRRFADILQLQGQVMDGGLHRENEYLSLVEEGAALFKTKEYDLALSRFWKAFRLRPSAPVVLFNIARTMEELNDSRAEDFYAAAVTQGNADAHYQLAAFCLRHGRADEAVGHLNAFLKQNKEHEDIFTAWARDTMQKLCPSPVLVWSKEK